MSKQEKQAKYTYLDFAYDVHDILVELEDVSEEIISKARDFIAREEKAVESAKKSQEKKKAANAGKPKELTDFQKKYLPVLEGILSENPITSIEINQYLDSQGLEPIKPMNLAKLMAMIPKVATSEVIKERIDKNGLRHDGKYKAYFIAS